MLPYYNFSYISIGILKIQVWGIFFVLALILGGLLLVINAKKQKIDTNITIDFLFWLLLGVVVGARLGYILTHLNEFQSVGQYLAIWQGGLALYGGLVGGALFGIIYLIKAKINIEQFLDIVAISLPLSIAVGRIGCYLRGEHLGGPTNFFMGVNVNGLRVHQTALYEAIINLFIFAFILFLSKRKKFDSYLIFIFLILYSLSRFFLDFFRVDEPIFFGLTPSEWISVPILLFSSIYVAKKLIQTSKRSILIND